MGVWRSAYTAKNATGAIKRLQQTWDMFAENAAPRQRSAARMLRGVNHASIELRYRHPTRSRQLRDYLGD